LKAVRFLLDSSLWAAPQGNPQPPKIPTLSRQLAEHAEVQGLHGLFVGFRTIHVSLFFFCHIFCNRQKDVYTEIYPGLKRDRHHRAALAPEKKQLKAIIHNM